MLMYLMIVCTGIVLLPSALAHQTKQSAWMVPLFLPIGIGSLSVWVACQLGQRFPELTLIPYSEVVLGKALGKVLASSFILFLCLLNVLVIRQVTGFLSLALLPGTPAKVLIFSIVLLGVYLALKGIEVIARMVQFILPLFIMSFALVMVLTIGDLEFGNLLPLMEGGLLPIVKSSMTSASLFGEIGLLTLIFPMVNKPQEIGRKAVISIIAAAVFLSTNILVNVLVFGPEVAGTYAIPFWSLAKFAQIGRYIQRSESLITILWVTGIIIKVTLLLYLSSLPTAQLFGLKSNKPALYSLALLQGILAFFPVIVSVKLMQILNSYWPPIGLGFELAVPLFLLLTAMIRKKRYTG